ncbi:MAG TPA: sugar kinase, partial [Novosphingobium sp.]|nr:sugar kinase [Novosphingobium sp.]
MSQVGSAQTGHIACFGEVMLRMTVPAGRSLAEAQGLEMSVGGAEANVAVGLAGLGWATRFVSVLPENALAGRVRGGIAACGVDTRFVASGAGRMGLYFLETGASLRPSAITYDRAGSAFATARPDQIDFAGALAGARLLHMSGITAALGPGGVELARAAMAAAHAAGVPVSFDPNYRALLWSAWDSDPAAILRELIGGADILFANHRDMSLVLGGAFSGDGAERRREAAEAAFAAFPRLQVMASTARQTVTQTHHRMAARVDLRDARHQTAEIEITDIIDRVGSGDAFAAGVLHGWLDGGDARAM